MDRESYATVLLAVSCIAAVGMSATTLESTLTQTPDDVIDIDFSKLPIGEDSGKTAKGAVQSAEGSEQAATSGEDGESSDQSSDPSDESSQSDGGASSDSGQMQAGGGEGDEGSGTGELSLLQRLLLLLERLMPLIAVLVLLALAYRYRRELLALALAVAGVLDDSTPADRSPTESTWPSERPSNDVHRAWLSMVERLDVDRPQNRTPSQCADAAVAANMDPSAVETLTTLFEEVRYGDAPVTDERRQRAREGLDGLDRSGTDGLDRGGMT